MYEVKTKSKTFKFNSREEAYDMVSELRNKKKEWSLKQYIKHKEMDGSQKLRTVIIDCST